MPVLVIGVGNMERGDDGAGLLVAQALREKPARSLKVEESSGEISSIVDLLESSNDVIIVDAMRSGKPAGSTIWIDPLSGSTAVETTISSTHGFGVAQAIDLLKTLGKLPRRVRLLGIEGQYFALGAPVSPQVQRAVKTAVGMILRSVKARRRK
jgi:hydrogenase maturation protease